MRVVEGQLVLSPSDLVEATACRHRMVTAFRVAHGVQEAGSAAASSAVSRAGDAHEASVVRALRDAGLREADLDGPVRGVPGWRLLAAATLEHLRRGPDDAGAVDVVLQGAVVLDLATPLGASTLLVGRPDFLRRTEAGWRVEDAKLARSVRPTAVLQTMLYRHALAEAGVAVHDDVRLHLGSGEVEDVPARSGDAWARRQLADVVADLAALPGLGVLDAGHVEHVVWCSVCDDTSPCGQQRKADRHLSGVADLRRDQARRLQAAGIHTVDALARASQAPPGLSATTFATLREQAQLQVEAETTGTVPVRVRPHPERVAAGEVPPGLWSLPDPDPGDVFFDMEGYPLFTDGSTGPDAFGLEYLFGAATLDDGADGGDGEGFTAFWGDDRAGEAAAFTAFVDWVQARREQHPGLHVYHYAAYEKTALARLAGRHETRGDVIDAWLREGLLVDLYTAVRGGLRAGVTSYSIKKVEVLYGMKHDAGELAVASAGESIEQYERYAESDDPELRRELREAITEYNRVDCVSTLRLRDYLLRLRADAVDAGTLRRLVVEEGDAPDAGEAAPRTSTQELRAELAEAAEALLDGHPVGDPVSDDPVREARRVLAGLLGYQVREEKAAWQDVFRVAEEVRLDAASGGSEAVDDAAVLGGLAFVDGDLEVRPRSRRVTWTFTAPAQETRVETGPVYACVAGVPVGMNVASLEPAPSGEGSTGGSAGDAAGSGDGTLEVVLWMSEKKATEHGWSPSAAPAVEALVAARIVRAEAQQRSLLELAEAVGSPACADPTGPRAAGRALLLGRASLALDVLPGQGEEGVARAVGLAHDADGLVLAVQGPPGAGKSYLGSKVVDALLASARDAGRAVTVGVTANSHAVVTNLLGTVHATTPWALVRHKNDLSGSHGKDESQWPPLCAAGEGACEQPARVTASVPEWSRAQVVGGTAWAFSPETSPPLDWLVVDEAGQMSLGDVLAASRKARNVLLLGDPQQLAKPARAAHPPGVGVSALEHLMGRASTMPGHLGIFQDQTWRMHEHVASFISDIAYDGRLSAHPSTADRRVLPLAGAAGAAGAAGSAGSPEADGEDGADAALSGTGLRYVPVMHEGDVQSSDTECAVVVALVGELLRRRWTMAGQEHDMTEADVLVVSPYNAQVQRLTAALAAAGHGGVRVGTVDRFQGQQAAAVVYSTASSDADAAPRGLGFLYDTHRLNVAVSRARCLAFWVGSPELLRPRVTARHQVALVDAHCRFVEQARVVDAAALTAASPGAGR